MYSLQAYASVGLFGVFESHSFACFKSFLIELHIEAWSKSTKYTEYVKRKALMRVIFPNSESISHHVYFHFGGKEPIW